MSNYELFGLPCSGKSYVCENKVGALESKTKGYLYMHEILKPSRKRTGRNIYRLQCVVIIMLLDFRLFSSFFSCLMCTKQKRNILIFQLLAHYCLYRRLVLRAKKEQKYYVADEGFLQILWAITLESNLDFGETFELFYNMIPANDVVHILVGCNETDLTDRLTTRMGNSRLERDTQLIRTAVENMEKLTLHIDAKSKYILKREYTSFSEHIKR